MIKMSLVIAIALSLAAGCGASRTTERFEAPISPMVEPKLHAQVIPGNGKGVWAVKLDWSAFPAESNWVLYRKPQGDTAALTEIARFEKDIRLFTDRDVQAAQTYEYRLITESLTGEKRKIASLVVVVPTENPSTTQ